MIKKFLLIPMLAAGVYVTMSSNQNGYSLNQTGSHGGGTGCGTCHGSSAVSGINVSIELDSAGTIVTSYKAGMTYTLRIKATNTTTFTLPNFGTQLSIVSGTGTASTNAGTLTALTSGTNIRTSSTIKYLSHTTPIAATTGTGATGTTYVAEATWVAPVAGTGTVKAYGVINAVNGNGNDDNGDKWNVTNASFTEQIASTAVSAVANNNIKLYPNPANEVLNIAGFEGKAAIMDMQGRTVATGSNRIDIAHLAAGQYIVVLQDGANSTTMQFVKQ